MDFFFFAIIGFLAQIVDGALGMAYGIISMSILLGIGITPNAASAAIHTAEIFTTGISGFSHAMFKNINYRLLFRLIVPGVLGSIIGAVLLSKIPANIIKPIISTYLLLMGIIVLYRAIRKAHWTTDVNALVHKALEKDKPAHQLNRLIPLGLFGGFCDAVGGGGWGALVTSSLLAQDEEDPHFTIGTTNLTEFLVTMSSSLTFFLLIGISHWRVILGLIAGGAIAAPLAAFVLRYIPPRALMFIAGTLILFTSAYNIIRLVMD